MGCYYSYLYKNVNLENTKLWSLKGKKMWIKVLKVYDGDTIWIAIKINRSIYKLSARLYGIDTPEMKPLKNKINRDIEIKNAKKAKEFLSNLVLNKVILIECGKWDKYGRLLITLFLKNGICSPDININKLMISKGHAKEYFGGTKK